MQIETINRLLYKFSYYHILVFCFAEILMAINSEMLNDIVPVSNNIINGIIWKRTTLTTHKI